MERRKWSAWTTHLKAFYRSYVNGTTFDVQNQNQEGIDSSRAQVNALMQLYGIIKRQINAFQAMSLGTASGNIPVPPHNDSHLRRASMEGKWPALSSGERLRLYRAFLRYELCSRLTGVPSMDAMADVELDMPRSFGIQDDNGDDEFWNNPFREDLTDDEVEEIASVKNFVQNTYLIIYIYIYGVFLEEVRTFALPARAHGLGPIMPARDWLAQDAFFTWHIRFHKGAPC